MIAQSEFLNASILIVDDQEANTLLLQQMLKQRGYLNVSATLDPLTVCPLHEANRYDLILLDLQMPVMDGFEVIDGLKKIETGGYLPVLVITAQPSHKLRALQAGAKDFVSKPFDLIEVQSRINNMLEVRLLYRKLANHNKILEQTVHQRTEELRASEARFKSFTELSTDWYWEQDTEGKFTNVHGPVYEMLGIESGQLLGETTLALEGRWNAAEKAALNENIANRKPFIDFFYSHSDERGRKRHLQVSGEPIFDSASRFVGYRGIGTDVTERMKPLEDLNRLRDAIDVIANGFVLVDSVTMCIVDVNASTCKMTGFARSELLELAANKIGISSFDSSDKASLNCKDGSLLSVSISWYPMEKNNSSTMVGMIFSHG